MATTRTVSRRMLSAPLIEQYAGRQCTTLTSPARYIHSIRTTSSCDHTSRTPSTARITQPSSRTYATTNVRRPFPSSTPTKPISKPTPSARTPPSPITSNDPPTTTSTSTPSSTDPKTTTTNPSSHRSRRPSTADPSLGATKLQTRDRGPESKEDTQTDFARMDVLGNTAAPATSVDICAWDGFVLDSGLRVGEGDGVLLVGADAFLWRPWMGGAARGGGVGGEGSGGVGGGGGVESRLVHGDDLKGGMDEVERTGGCVNAKGQFEVAEEVWGLLKTLWPRPDLLIIGTGPSIRPLAPTTKQHLQSLGLRIEVLDTRNAASQFNMLATERGVYEVAAALVPIGFGLKD